jgi:TPR repeat protein
MEKSWYNNFFSRPQPPSESSEATDYEDAESQFRMGVKFASDGPAQDYAQAAQWYRKAATQSHSLAQFNLGMMCAKGQGMDRDPAQSVIWFIQAAHSGDAGAQFHLGQSCHRASLTELPASATESRIEAYKWYHLAAGQGYAGSAEAGNGLIHKMTREEVTTGDTRVAEFKLAHPQSSPE